MSLKLYEESDIQNIADAIRGKNGLSDTYKVSQMASAVTAIPTGGGGGNSVPAIFNKTITKYIDSEGINQIPAYAFADCSGLSMVDFPSVTTIGNNAFQNCYSLSSLSFPNCESIGMSVFLSCSSLNYIDLPACKSIGSSAFFMTPLVNGISLPACSMIYTSAFRGTSLSYLYLPECTYTYSWIFENAHLLKEFIAPKLSKIDIGVFFSCWSLSSVDAPAVTYLGSNAFGYCSNISQLYLPLCSNLSSSAFQNCSQLRNITVAPTKICNSAMYNCSRLSQLQLLNASVPSSFFTDAFNNTPLSLSTYLGYYGSIYVPSSKVNNYKTATNWVVYSDRITSLGAEYDTSYVYAYEFSGSNITSLPSEKSNAILVGNYAFLRCLNLTEVTLNSCLRIGNSAFFSCSALSKITLMASSVCALGYSAFAWTPIGTSTYLGYYGSVYVPSSLVDSYKTAWNWSAYSDRITAIPE